MRPGGLLPSCPQLTDEETEARGMCSEKLGPLTHLLGPHSRFFPVVSMKWLNFIKPGGQAEKDRQLTGCLLCVLVIKVPRTQNTVFQGDQTMGHFHSFMGRERHGLRTIQ